jgi:hypothetical protein
LSILPAATLSRVVFLTRAALGDDVQYDLGDVPDCGNKGFTRFSRFGRRRLQWASVTERGAA